MRRNGWLASHSPALELSALTRRFGERVVLRELSLSLPAGGTMVVFGPNGAGKTTLLRVLAGLLRPHGGRVRVLGRELPREGFAIRGMIGWLGHEPLLYRELTARENLRFHARLHGIEETRVEQSLAEVGMTGRAEEPMRELSRGMVQRVATARAVLGRPPLLLLDEPLSNLDPAARELVEPLIGRSSGCTRVIASHDPQAGLAEADVVLGLRGGRAELFGEAAGFEAERVMELYR